MKKYYCLGLLLLLLHNGNAQTGNAIHFYNANNPLIQYTGRISFADKLHPRSWCPGVYMKAAFEGTYCEIMVNDEVLYGIYHNYVSIIIDDKAPQRIKLSQKNNALKFDSLSNAKHTITVCKSTECGIGYMDFAGINCKKLLPLPVKPTRKIEFIGNSITCGMASDLTIPCGTGDWYDQHNAWLSYGAITARTLKAEFHLTSESGIGLMHSCCDKPILMPQVFDKVDLRDDSIKWNFAKYQPDVVTICLGQNDGIQDSVTFCDAYIKFIKRLRVYYPKATVICLSSPMADENLVTVLKKYITSIVAKSNMLGDKNVYKYFYSKRYYHGCGTHPDLAEHQEIANELTAYIKQIKHW